MNMYKLALLTILTMLAAGCSQKPAATMPEVNDENCKTENVLKIEDKAMRQEFVSKCIRRDTPLSRAQVDSKPKSW